MMDADNATEGFMDNLAVTSADGQTPRLGESDSVRVAAVAELPSRFGVFKVVSFETPDGKEHGAVVKGNVNGIQDVPVRLHSECFTGDLMGSYRCDCREQLEAALSFVGQAECGVVLYLRQEGRGIGLANKIRAYALQDAGLDTVEANHALGFGDDLRSYGLAAQMLEELGVGSVKLLTNNPRKLSGLEQNGICVTGRIPLQMTPNEHNEHYLDVKRRKSGHLL